jgi:hypothetical protein
MTGNELVRGWGGGSGSGPHAHLESVLVLWGQQGPGEGPEASPMAATGRSGLAGFGG